MSKYGRIDMGAPDYSKQLAALEDNLNKGLLTQSEYRKKKDNYTREKMLYIVATNGGYTPSKKYIKQFNALREKLSIMKEQDSAKRLLQNRNAFLQEMQKSVEEKEVNGEAPPEASN